MTHPAMHLIAQIADAANIPYDEAYQAVVDAAYKHPISTEDLAWAVLAILGHGVPWPGVVDIITDMADVGISPTNMCFTPRVFRLNPPIK